MPTSSAPPPRSTSISSQLWTSLRLGFTDFDSQTRAPAASSPIIEPGLAQCTVTVSPEGSTTSARKLQRKRGGAVAAPPVSSALRRSLRQRIRAQLEVHGHGLHALAAFDQPRRAVAARRPQPASLPAGIGIVDAAVESLGVEAERIRHPQRDHLAVLERDQAVHEVGRRHRHVLAEPERVVLVDPAVVARLGAVLADAFEARPRILVERPALRTLIAGRLGSVERAFA